jgi:tetratricopeptide (TPR) repeat protein
MSRDGVRSVLRAVVDAGAVGAALVFLASYFPASVMFSRTTTNGGDMGTHYYPAFFLRHVLLPHGSVIGWCPGNYCGYPLFQFYFPLPFVLAAGMSLLVPFQIAFKLATQVGTFLLPICSYFSLRLAGVPFPGPALGALTPLCFLFMEANSMWGGNIPSTLAGEFALVLGLSLTILFVGSIQRAMKTGRGTLWNGILVALIGLSHGYTLIWAGPVSLLELVSTRNWLRRVGTLIAVYGLAILLMGFFFLELVGYGPWTTAYNHSWPIQSWREVLPPILWPAAGVSAVTSLVVAVVALVRREAFPRPLGMLWGAMGLAVVFWATAHSFHVVDIRFWPFVQLGLCLTAAAALGYVFAWLPMPEVWPLVGALVILPYVQSRVTFIPAWITWNYAGFERKATWPVFEKLNQHLLGDFRSPRVVYEHSADNESLGTVRAFENLPLFSGRNTLEGLYMQSSPTAPFVFFIQSEISKDVSCPFPDYGCSRLDLDRGIGHLRMFNVSHFVLRSPIVKAAAAKHPGLAFEASFGPFDVYRLRENADRYAIPLALAPVAVRTATWKEVAYRWFKRAGPDDPTPVFVKDIDASERAQFAAVVDDVKDELPRKALDPPPALEEQMDAPDHITVTGARPGHPILIRISYHPRWRAVTGEKIWLAGPSFMLVFPKSDRVELVFDGGAWVTAGHLFTTVGLIVLALAFLPVGARLGERARTLVPEPVMALVRSTEAWDLRRRRTVLAGGVATAMALFAMLAIVKRVPNNEAVYRTGQRLYDANRLEESVPFFREAQHLAPLSATAIHATYYEAIVYFRREKWQDAITTFTRLMANFPEAPNFPEALYHVGLCRLHLGNLDGAREAWQEVQARFPSTPWGKYAGDRLAEVKQAATGG